MPRMDAGEARRRFTAARVARLATVDDAGLPRLVPVVFAAHGRDGIVTAVDRKPKSTSRLARLHDIEVTPAVCLLADVYDEDWDRLWWARADGGARILHADATDPETRRECGLALALLREKYAQYRRTPPEGPVIAVTVHRWTGWRAADAPSADAPDTPYALPADPPPAGPAGPPPFGTAGSGYAAGSR
ncbi:PPOX class F420-dependent oxidoreductase [Streptomyces naganishii JCM 4654]|uniref:PPOX class F420-dependent oxidoreductase n=2 Tax=Streptomyces naganishii TaxID=285447 RepID=A0A918Y5Q9_9ACTN|nr:PPOX class F420-dependent oxidoreductase [Streptomyces naganishii JCM 4654]